MFTLSNGLEVHVLPTEYKNDEVLINLCLPGGKSLIEDNEIFTFEDNTLSCINNSVGLGNFSRSELMKALSGKKASLENYRKVYTRLYHDVAGASLYIVGNVNVDSIKPLLERYVASLPKGKKAAQYVDRGERLRAGIYEDRFAVEMEAPKVSVFQFYNARFEPKVENRIALQALQYILNMAYTDKLREEEGGPSPFTF